MELLNSFSVPVPIEQAWSVLTDVERIAPCLPGAELHEVEGDDYHGVVRIKVGPITARYKGTASFVSKDADARVAVLRAQARDVRGQGNASATVTASLTPAGSATDVQVRTDLDISGKVAQFGRGVLADVSGNLIAQFVARLEADVLTAPQPEAAAGAPPAVPASVGAGAVDAAPTTANGVVPAAATALAGGAVAAGTSVGPDTSAVEGTVPAPAAATGGRRRIESSPAEPIDLLGSAGSPLLGRLGQLGRLGPAVAGFAFGLLVGGWALDVRLRRR